MTIFGNFDFFPTGWMVENTLFQNRTLLRKRRSLWSLPKCFWFLICMAYYFTKNHIFLLNVLRNYRTGPGLYLQYTNFLSLSPVIPVYTLRKKREIKTMSILTRLPCSAAPLRSLNWLNGRGRENTLKNTKIGRWKIAEV